MLVEKLLHIVRNGIRDLADLRDHLLDLCFVQLFEITWKLGEVIGSRINAVSCRNDIPDADSCKICQLRIVAVLLQMRRCQLFRNPAERSVDLRASGHIDGILPLNKAGTDSDRHIGCISEAEAAWGVVDQRP